MNSNDKISEEEKSLREKFKSFLCDQDVLQLTSHILRYENDVSQKRWVELKTKPNNELIDILINKELSNMKSGLIKNTFLRIKLEEEHCEELYKEQKEKRIITLNKMTKEELINEILSLDSELEEVLIPN